MNVPEISGSIDLVAAGGLIAVAGYLLDSRVAVAVGLAVGVIGLLKVTYDHVTGFEDPWGIEEWAGRSDAEVDDAE